MRILTCNIRYSAAPDGENDWIHRRELAAKILADQDADLIGFQEMREDQFKYLSGALPGFDYLVTADEPGGVNPVNTIFYRRDRFERVSGGAYWLSETPHVPGSRSWDSACVRLCCWVCLVEKSNRRQLRFVNTHLDHISQPAREAQAALINADAGVYPLGFPQVLTGDMNANSFNPALQILLKNGWKDSYQTVQGVIEPGNSFHKFLGPAYTGMDGKIDWILYRGGLIPCKAHIITSNVNGRYPSDHYFVSADFDWA